LAVASQQLDLLNNKMSNIKRFEDIIAWQKARVLCNDVYKLTNTKSFKSDKDLVWQLRRAAVSIMANIAEGFERRGDKQFAYFLDISLGSIAEVKSHIYISSDLEYINNVTFDELILKIDELSKITNGLRKYLKS